jgi:hypothetical protein
VANLLDVFALSSKLDGAQPMQVEFLRTGRPMMTNIAPETPMMMPANAPGWGATVQQQQQLQQPQPVAVQPVAVQPAAMEGGGWMGGRVNAPMPAPAPMPMMRPNDWARTP